MPHWTTAAQRSTGPSRLRELGLRALFQSNRKRKAQHSYGRLAMAEACESRVLLSSLTVNSALDNLTPGDGLVTLREAIIAANNDTTTDLSQTGSGADVIQFDASLANQTINLTLGELEISSEVTIEGLGANLLTVDAGNSSRVFLIDDGDNNNDLNVSISGLTISGGLTLNTDATTNAGRGGGIHSYENLVLTESHVANNETQSDGGGIWIRYGDLTLLNSTVSGNIGKFLGGGIYARQNQVLISNSTISGNVLTAGNSGVSGGGFYGTGNTVTIRYSTITDNTAMRGGGVLGADTLSHTIVAGNTASQGPDLFGSVTANFSLIGDTTDATISGADNITNTSADLEALADNGGPVPTHKLAATSPAINAGDATLVANVGNVPEFDQRGTGFSRVNGSSIDIGAYEYNAVSLVGTGGSFIDTFTVFMDGTEVVVDLNMAEIFRQELSTVDSLELNGLGGTDTFNIDQSGGTLTLPISIIGDSHLTIVNSVHSITAGGDTITKTPVKGDILNFLDSSNTSASNYRIDSDSISRTNSGIVTFSGIEVFNVYTSTSAASDIDILTTPGSVVYTVNAGDQADDIDVTTSATNGVLIINAGGGSDSIDIAGTGDSPLIFLRGDDGNDLINVADTGSSLSFGLDIDGGNDDDTITIQNIGTALLNVSGDAGNDQINLMNSDASSLSDLFGGADDDTFTVAAGLSGVRVFGDGQGMVGDQLNMTGGSFTNVTYDFDNANDGSINYDGSTITYTGLEPITDTTTATNRTFEFNGAEETITLSDDSNADDGVSFIDSTLGESVTFNNPTGLLTINTTTGSGA
ncbi:MAG: hypothetical protein KDA78_16785, partial [Planctomycetaceae bacterium]|nr:hypothetical protein [Planctomycetaceae bacterium]